MSHLEQVIYVQVKTNKRINKNPVDCFKITLFWAFQTSCSFLQI